MLKKLWGFSNPNYFLQSIITHCKNCLGVNRVFIILHIVFLLLILKGHFVSSQPDSCNNEFDTWIWQNLPFDEIVPTIPADHRSLLEAPSQNQTGFFSSSISSLNGLESRIQDWIIWERRIKFKNSLFWTLAILLFHFVVPCRPLILLFWSAKR